MCGIVGILGHHEAAPTLVEALKRLEYRGYDSAGIATVEDGALNRRRAVGKLVNLSDLLVHEPLSGKSGIGHTRWATHGAPSVTNAHPHKSGPVAVVHNGIFDNASDLRARLTADGVVFLSETDTEVLAHLIGRSEADTLEGKVREAVGQIEGTYGVAVLHADFPDRIVVARNGSPVVLGIGVAVLGGLGLGKVMTGVIDKPVQSWWVFWPYALTGAGVIAHFDFIAGSDSGFGGKPAPGQLLAFAEALDLDPSRCAMVGDSPHDLDAGRAAGMACVAVLTGPGPADDLRPLADVVLPDIGHLRAWLDAR